MDCAIWLGRKKIFSAKEIADNFDIAAVRGYYLGGSLINWLKTHGGKAYANALSALSPDDPALNDRLTEIFVQKKCEAPVHKSDENLIRAVDMLKRSGVVSGSGIGSFNMGSYLSGSFNYHLGSFSAGSFSRGSFGKTWEWEWEWCLGSFRGGSFRFGNTSFGGSYRFNLGSFGYGSYRLGSLPAGMLPSSYKGVPLSGFGQITADEYDAIMYRCLNTCPLNRFGYGIHNI